MVSNGSTKSQSKKGMARPAPAGAKGVRGKTGAAAAAGSVNGGGGESASGKAAGAADTWTLRLYVAGDSPKSRAAISNLKRLCEEHLAGKYEIEVVDLKSRPELAKAHQILALPTLIRKVRGPSSV